MNTYVFNFETEKSWSTQTKAKERLSKIYVDTFPYAVAHFDFSNNAKTNPGVLWPFGMAQYNFEGTWFIKQCHLLIAQISENFRNHI